MTDFFKHISERKESERQRLAALPFAEKLKLLEKMRDREASIVASRSGSRGDGLSDRLLLLREERAEYGAGKD